MMGLQCFSFALPAYLTTPLAIAVAWLAPGRFEYFDLSSTGLEEAWPVLVFTAVVWLASIATSVGVIWTQKVCQE